MVISNSPLSSDTVAPIPTGLVSAPVPTDEELVAIAVAVEAYMASDALLDIAPPASDNVLSSWLQAGRLAATKSAARTGYTDSQARRGNGLWRNFFTVMALAATTFGLAPGAVAESTKYLPIDDSPVKAAPNMPAFYGTWNYKDSSQTLRVLVGAPSQKVDLDLPDGGSIYNTDGSLVARVGPRSSWTLNLATLSSGNRGSYTASSRRQKFVFTGKSNIDVATTKGLAGGDIQNTAFAPSGGANFFENRFALGAEDGYIVVPDARSSEGAVPLVGANGKLYRGSLLLKPSSTAPVAANIAVGATAFSAPPVAVTNAIAVINVVKIEDYLLSVVPSEVPASWPQEVLKAQAIAARSYAFANLGKHKAEGYDLKDTVEDQVYKGVASENNETNVACAITTGLVIKQNDQVVSAYFHSTSGGSTELAENVWSKPLPYLKSVVDYDDASPLFNWQRSFTVAQLSKLLNLNVAGISAPPSASWQSQNAPQAGGATAGDQITGIFVVSRHKASGQRVKHMIAVGTNSGRVLSGVEVRKLLNLPSTQFSVYHADGAYVFSGRGYGHGLGLSQWGAKALADKGYNAGQILSYYYKDVTIESMGEPNGTNGSI